MRVTVRDLLGSKGCQVWSVAPDSTVYEALEMMSEKDVGALPVLRAGELVGFFSERDYARHTIGAERGPKDTFIEECMTKNVYYIAPDKTIEDCMQLMSAQRIRHLPVMQNGELVGMISIGDVVQKVISEQDYKIGELENFIRAL